MDTKPKQLKITTVKSDKTKDVRLVVDNETAPPREYANHVQVTHTPFDFTIDFCDLGPFGSTPPLTDMGDHAVLMVKSRVRLAVPAKLIEPMIEALRKNWETYKANNVAEKEE